MQRNIAGNLSKTEARGQLLRCSGEKLVQTSSAIQQLTDNASCIYLTVVDVKLKFRKLCRNVLTLFAACHLASLMVISRQRDIPFTYLGLYRRKIAQDGTKSCILCLRMFVFSGPSPVASRNRRGGELFGDCEIQFASGWRLRAGSNGPTTTRMRRSGTRQRMSTYTMT